MSTEVLEWDQKLIRSSMNIDFGPLGVIWLWHSTGELPLVSKAFQIPGRIPFHSLAQRQMLSACYSGNEWGWGEGRRMGETQKLSVCYFYLSIKKQNTPTSTQSRPTAFSPENKRIYSANRFLNRLLKPFFCFLVLCSPSLPEVSRANNSLAFCESFHSHQILFWWHACLFRNEIFSGLSSYLSVIYLILSFCNFVVSSPILFFLSDAFIKTLFFCFYYYF